jgi:steroid delta-isomerase-like uncharacterized protein
VSEENKALIRRWFEEVWNRGRVDAIDEMLAEDGVAYGLSDSPIVGPKDFKPFHAQFRGAFPDIEVVVEDVIAEGDKVAARCSVRGTHRGDHLGVPASQAQIDFTGTLIASIRDGKFVESWNSFDFARLYQQIGASS